MQHGIGAARVDLSGTWVRDADVDFQVAFGSGELKLPVDVDIEGPDGVPLRLLRPHDREISPPTLRLSTHFDLGDIQVIN